MSKGAELGRRVMRGELLLLAIDGHRCYVVISHDLVGGA